jgi:hypothetical protein
MKMCALEQVHGWSGFDEEKDLGRPIHAEEIGDGLLRAIVENVEVLAGEASDELTARVGNYNANVYAVYADMNVGSSLNRLLGKCGRDKDESENE